MQEVELLSYKHNGKKHRTWETAWVESDDPLILRIPANTPVHNPDGSTWSSGYDVEAFFPADKWFNVFTLKKATGTEWYCNVAAPPSIEEQKIRFIDYDLDIYVYTDGHFQVLDRDEFEEHARTMRYSDEIKQKAETGLHDLKQAIKMGYHPFAR